MVTAVAIHNPAPSCKTQAARLSHLRSSIDKTTINQNALKNTTSDNRQKTVNGHGLDMVIVRDASVVCVNVGGRGCDQNPHQQTQVKECTDSMPVILSM